MNVANVDWTAVLAHVRAVLADRAAPEVAPFLGDWPLPCRPRATAPAALAVLRWLDAAVEQAPPGPLVVLARDVRDAAAALTWRQSYRPEDAAAAFLESYGWCELFGRSGPIACEQLACGILLLGPHTHYPSHSHTAEELYVPLSGAAGWQRGSAQFVVRQPGERILHASGEAHAMRTAAAPLLALYLWRGAGLGESARLHPRALA